MGVQKRVSQDGQTYNNPLIPGENCKLGEASDKIPSSSDVASYKDR